MFEDDFQRQVDFLTFPGYSRQNNLRESFAIRKESPIKNLNHIKHIKHIRRSKTHMKPVKKTSTIGIDGQDYTIDELTFNKFQRRAGYIDSSWVKSKRGEY